ncbi:MAG: VCBS repeat-containing protein [Bryobacteraceae bacterium]
MNRFRTVYAAALLAISTLVPAPATAQPKPMLPLFGAAPIAGTWTNSELYPRTAADADGDGKADIVGFANDGVYVALSSGNAFRPATRWVASFGTNAGSWSGFDKFPRTAADVNGDGKADIVGFGQDGVYVSLSDGKQFAAPTRWRANDFSVAAGWSAYSTAPRFAADVNGDGKADIVGVASDGVYVSLSNGSAFGAIAKWSTGFAPPNWTNMNQVPRAVADVNGDGKADIAGFATDGVYVALSTGTGFAAPGKWLAGLGTDAGWTSFDDFPRVLADVNGDRKADAVGFAREGVYVALSTGLSFSAPKSWSPYYGQNNGGWTSTPVLPRVLGDFDGDGKQDVIGFAYTGVHGSVSTGAAFAAPSDGLPSDLRSATLAGIELSQRVAYIAKSADAASLAALMQTALGKTGNTSLVLQLLPTVTGTAALSSQDQELLTQLGQAKQEAAAAIASRPQDPTAADVFKTFTTQQQSVLDSLKAMLEQAQQVRQTIANSI